MVVADTKEPRIQEIDSDEEDSDDAPDLQETGGDGAVAGGATDTSKQSRSEKKSRKAVAKLGMKQIFGIQRITVKKAKSMLFVIQKPDVFKAPFSDTYVVFGEFKGEDMSGQQMAHMAQLAEAAAKSKAEAGGDAPAAKMPAIAEESGASSGAEPEEKDIELVTAQAGCTKEEAIVALKKHNNDIVEAIMGFQTGS